MIKGYDLSSVQGNISQANWQTIAASDIKFIIVKCFQGNDGIDPYYVRNIANAKAVGLQVLAYHFLYPLPNSPGHLNRDPVSQAKLHFNAANGVRACADLEWPVKADWPKWGCSASQIVQWTLDYLAAYSQLSGEPMIIYTYPDFAQIINMAAHPQFAQYPLWIASYENTPTIPLPFTNYVLWQNSGGTSAHLPSGAPVDTDLCPDSSLVWGGAVATSSPAPMPNQPPPISEPQQPQPPTDNSGANIWTSIGNTISSVMQIFSRNK